MRTRQVNFLETEYSVRIYLYTKVNSQVSNFYILLCIFTDIGFIAHIPSREMFQHHNYVKENAKKSNHLIAYAVTKSCMRTHIRYGTYFPAGLNHITFVVIHTSSRGKKYLSVTKQKHEHFFHSEI